MGLQPLPHLAEGTEDRAVVQGAMARGVLFAVPFFRADLYPWASN